MGTLEILTQILLIILALVAGAAVGKQGVITGRAAHLVGVYDVTIAGRRVVLDVLNFRVDKVFYRLAILPAN